jgi:flagellar basal-body rod protein FlgF
MLKSIYTPLAGALGQERVMEVIANNLANLNTVGFKGDSVTFKLLEPEPYKNYADPLPPANYKVNLDDVMPLHGNEVAYVGVADVHRDNTQGPSINTGNNLDFMIEGDGHFAVQTPEGVRYTRSGSFALSPDGVLMTKAGHPVQGERGDIFLRGETFQVNHRGEIYQDGELVDRLQVFKLENPDAIERVGDNYVFYGGEPESLTRVEHPSVQQGFLEGSNVNAIRNLTSMILAHRSYEAYQKAVADYDKMMDKSSNALGEVRA